MIITLRVITIPKITSINEKAKIKGTVSMVINKNQYLVKPNNILVMTEDKLEIGDKIKIDCLLKSPSKQSNFYLFDYQKYLLSKNITKICYPTSIKKQGKTSNLILLSNL